MEDLNKLREYLQKGETTNSDNESVSADELLIPDSKSSPTQLQSVSNLNEDNDEYEGLPLHEVNYIKNCNNETIRKAKLLNRKKKLALEKVARRLKIHQQRIYEQIKTLRDETYAIHCKKNLKFRLGMPYFKDKNLFPCPYNEDYHKMKRNKELPLQSYYIPRIWTIPDKSKLAAAVYEYICRNRCKELERELENLRKIDNVDSEICQIQKEISYLNDKEIVDSIVKAWNNTKVLSDEEVLTKKKELSKEIGVLEEQLENIEDTNIKNDLTKRIFDLNSEKNNIIVQNYIARTVTEWNKYIDWLDISTNALSERHGDSDCKFLWFNYMSPNFSKRPWSEEENKRLAVLVQKYNMEDWEAIAQELSINKSAYQCCIHFFSSLWDKSKREKWSKEEEQYLKNIVETCRVGDYIPWSRVAKYFTDRNRMQIYTHYVYCLNPQLTKGRFTICEDILLTALMKKYQSFIKTSYFFPNRQINQLRDRFKSMGDDLRNWTVDDDLKILQHVKEHGDRNWNAINIDKNSALVRHRFNVIHRWMLDHPGQSIVGIERRHKSVTSRNRQHYRYQLVQTIVQILLDKSKEETPEIIFSIKYIDKLIDEYGDKTYIKSIKPKTKTDNVDKKDQLDIDFLIREFLQCSYKFVGRTRIVTNEVIDASTKRVKATLNMLGAKLKIPDTEILQDNLLFDELDIAILTKLHSEQNKEPDIINEPIISISSTVKLSKTIVFDNKIANLPPEPGTLIGFRGMMIHNDVLKRNAKGCFENVHQYLEGLKYSRKMIEHKLDEVKNKEQVVHERTIFKRRFKSIFKWPALMSLPANEPKPPFTNDMNVRQRTIVTKPNTTQNLDPDIPPKLTIKDFAKLPFPINCPLTNPDTNVRLSPGMSTIPHISQVTTNFINSISTITSESKTVPLHGENVNTTLIENSNDKPKKRGRRPKTMNPKIVKMAVVNRNRRKNLSEPSSSNTNISTENEKVIQNETNTMETTTVNSELEEIDFLVNSKSFQSVKIIGKREYKEELNTDDTQYKKSKTN